MREKRGVTTGGENSGELRTQNTGIHGNPTIGTNSQSLDINLTDLSNNLKGETILTLLHFPTWNPRPKCNREDKKLKDTSPLLIKIQLKTLNWMYLTKLE